MIPGSAVGRGAITQAYSDSVSRLQRGQVGLPSQGGREDSVSLMLVDAYDNPGGWLAVPAG